jgi:2-succinyl-6-hydroxy-2,4-cyclohexadiene-1-carboxylate synthase
MADDIAVLIEQLNLGQAHIIGSSVGAEVGLSLAARYPERVLSLVCDGALANEFGPYSAWQGSEAEFRSQAARNIEAACSSAEQVYPSLDALVAARRPGLEQAGWWNEAVENYLRYGACEIAPGQFGRCWQSHAARQYLEDYFFNLRLEKTYSQVQCPVLLLPDDETLQDSAARAAMEGLASLASQAQIAQAPGWIHPFGWMINPVPAIQAILPFLEASTRL